MEAPLRKKISALERLLQTLERLQEKISPAQHEEFINHVSASAQLVAREYIHVPPEEHIGEAYLAFRADEDPDVVLKELYKVRETVGAPESIELILYDAKDQVPLDANLPECWDTIERWGEEYLLHPYMMRARLESATNRQANEIVENILGILLDEKETPFRIYDGNQYTDQQYMKHGKRYICSDGPSLNELDEKKKKA